MIELHRATNSRLADEIDEKLRDLVVAYRTHFFDEQAADKQLPCICETGREISGERQIREYLISLEQELGYQRMFSGDACYIDPETGEVC